MRRLLDVIVSVTGLLLLLPVLAVVAATILVTMGRPVLFRQRRVGRSGKEFTLLKFRTMTVDRDGSSITVAGDPRITKLGRVLRASKLDEVPQLINVLTGSMSLLGPRPEVSEYVTQWPQADARIILAVRPGMTDPASIKYRHESALLAEHAQPQSYYEEVVLPDKLRIYRHYVQDRTFTTEVRVIFGTLRALLSSRSTTAALGSRQLSAEAAAQRSR